MPNDPKTKTPKEMIVKKNEHIFGNTKNSISQNSWTVQQKALSKVYTIFEALQSQ